MADQKVPCTHCGATGKVLVETVRVSGQAGDVAFLKLAKECFVECARLDGAYPGSSNLRVGALVKSAQAVGGEAQAQIEEMYVDAPPEMIIQALAVIEELREKVKERQVRNITVQSMPPKEDAQDGPETGLEGGDG